jgi:hypothetical protein
MQLQLDLELGNTATEEISGRADLFAMLASGAPRHPLGHRRSTPWATGGAQLHHAAASAGAPT